MSCKKLCVNPIFSDLRIFFVDFIIVKTFAEEVNYGRIKAK